MRAQVTVFYGEDGRPLVRTTKNYQLPEEDEDTESFDEARCYVVENVLEAYQSEGHDLENDDDISVGVDLLVAWILPEWFDTKAEAESFMEELMDELNESLSDLE